MADSPHIAIQIEQERIRINRAASDRCWGIFITDYGDSDYQIQSFAETDRNDDDVFYEVWRGFERGDDMLCHDAMAFLRKYAPCEFARIVNFCHRHCIVRNVKMRED